MGQASSGSWLGYHSRIYYANFETPPHKARFSQEWGLATTFAGTRGDWREYPAEEVKEFIRALAHHPDLSEAMSRAAEAKEIFQSAKAEIESILRAELETRADDFLETSRHHLRDTNPLTPSEVVQILAPKGLVMTRDEKVLGQGTQAPPHIEIAAEVLSIDHSFGICKLASDVTRKAAAHLERRSGA